VAPSLISYFEASNESKRDVFFYIDNGGVELDAILQPGNKEMTVLLQKWGYQQGKDWVFLQDAQARHFEAAWAKRFPDALLLTLQGLASRGDSD
jgi:predicted alpha/beta superfamily hydrolase